MKFSNSYFFVCRRGKIVKLWFSSYTNHTEKGVMECVILDYFQFGWENKEREKKIACIETVWDELGI